MIQCPPPADQITTALLESDDVGFCTAEENWRDAMGMSIGVGMGPKGEEEAEGGEMKMVGGCDDDRALALGGA